MKHSIFTLLILLTASLACKTLVSAPVVVETSTVRPSATPTPIPTVQATSTLQPAPAAITCTDDSCLNACLKRIDQTLPRNSFQPPTGAYSGDNIDINLAYYAVADGELGPMQILYAPDTFKVYQDDVNAQKNIWMYASGLLPPDELQRIDEFEIFYSSNYSGWVRPGGASQDDRSHWTLGVEITSAQYPVDLTYTLVHEYGHLITLNTDQIVSGDYFYGWDQDPMGCSEFLSPDGCSKPDSYINLFYGKFWKGELYEQWLKEVEKPQVNSSDEFRTLVKKFYDKHPEQFSREYASTNIDEDIAESFMNFVLEPKPNNTGVTDQKILFFYKFPELVSTRQTMIENICSYTQ